MDPREGLYKKLINSAPYGTLFFFHDVCLECSPSAERLLGCHRDQLVGSALNQVCADEAPAWRDLKRLLRENPHPDQGLLRCTVRCADSSVDLDVLTYRPDADGCELAVTLIEREAGHAAAALPLPEPLPSEALPNAPSLSESAPPEPALRERRAPPYLGRLYALDLQTPRRHHHDSLTGLPNRQYLIDRLNACLDEYRREESCGALLMIDLDHFKDVNDSWGHSVGDQILRKLAATLMRAVPPEHLLVRLSGDEFVLFVPQLSSGASRAAWEARQWAERILELVSVPLFHDGLEVAITASIGIALITNNAVTGERALQHADSAMYEAKRKGRNGLAFFDPRITENARRQIGLNTRLRRAVDHQEFALYIQPQLSVTTNRLRGGEALLRWVSSDNEFCAPTDFIPVLEASGLIVNVGHWVIRTACEYLRSYLDAGLWQEHMRLGINISPRQFLDPQLFDVLRHSLSSYRIDPQYLDFEITESLLIHDVEEVIRKMRRIKSLGAQFSIDDFGIGYSSMVYLKRLPLDHLKIDREFIQNIHRDPECRGVVEAIMAVSRQYGFQVTAEGVERPESLEVLRQVGCDHYQGAHYSMPVNPDRFRAMLAGA